MVAQGRHHGDRMLDRGWWHRNRLRGQSCGDGGAGTGCGNGGAGGQGCGF